MDINKQWQLLEEAKFSQSHSNKSIIMQAIQNESKSTISILKNRLRHKINWIIFFIVAFIGIAVFQYQNTGIFLFMTGATLIYAIGFLLLYNEYKKMGVTYDFEHSALDIMRYNLNRIKSALRKESIFGMTIMPFALIGGIILSHLFHGKPISEGVHNAFSTYNIILMVILGAGAMYLANKANQYAYGSHIQQLEDQITELEKL